MSESMSSQDLDVCKNDITFKKKSFNSNVYRNELLEVEFHGRKKLIKYLEKQYFTKNVQCELCYEEFKELEMLQLHLINEHDYKYHFQKKCVFNNEKMLEKKLKKGKVGYTYVTKEGKEKNFKLISTLLNYLIGKEGILNLGELIRIVKDSETLIENKNKQKKIDFNRTKKIARENLRDMVNYVVYCIKNNTLHISNDSKITEKEVANGAIDLRFISTTATKDTKKHRSTKVTPNKERPKGFMNLSISPTNNEGSEEYSIREEEEEKEVEEEGYDPEEVKKNLEEMEYDPKEKKVVNLIDVESISSKRSDLQHKSVSGLKFHSGKPHLMRKKAKFSSVRATPGKRPVQDIDNLEIPEEILIKKGKTSLKKRSRPEGYNKFEIKRKGRNDFEANRIQDFTPQNNGGFNPYNRDSQYYEQNEKEFYPNRISSQGNSHKNSPYTTPDKDFQTGGERYPNRMRSPAKHHRRFPNQVRSPSAGRMRSPSGPKKYPNRLKSPAKFNEEEVPQSPSILSQNSRYSYNDPQDLRDRENERYYQRNHQQQQMYRRLPNRGRVYRHQDKNQRQYPNAIRRTDYYKTAMMNDEQNLMNREMELHASMKYGYQMRYQDRDFDRESPALMKHAVKHRRVMGRGYNDLRKHAVRESYPDNLYGGMVNEDLVYRKKEYY